MCLEYLYDKNPCGFFPVSKSVEKGYEGGIDLLVGLRKLSRWESVVTILKRDLSEGGNTMKGKESRKWHKRLWDNLKNIKKRLTSKLKK